MKLAKILVATDFSDEADVALTQALDIARHQDARLVLLHVGVVPEHPIGTPSTMHSTVAEYMRLVQADLARDRKRLGDIRERVSGQGVEVSQMFIDGIPDKGICAAAEESGADLVVMGTHGRTGFKRFFLGSIAERVVRMCKKPVLVARASKNPTAGGYRRILVPTDFSPSAELALDLAVDAAAPEGHVDVLHCWHLPPMSHPYYVPTKAAQGVVTSFRGSITEGTKKLGNELMDRHRRPGIEIAFHQLEEAPAHGIQSWLEKHPADLVVTGSHGRRLPARLLLGSVAESTVRHSRCSVLVVHAPAETAGDMPADIIDEPGS